MQILLIFLAAVNLTSKSV